MSIAPLSVGLLSIPFETLSQRHLVYVYLTVWVLQFGYAGWLLRAWNRSRHNPEAPPPAQGKH